MTAMARIVTRKITEKPDHRLGGTYLYRKSKEETYAQTIPIEEVEVLQLSLWQKIKYWLWLLKQNIMG